MMKKHPILVGHAADGDAQLNSVQQVASFICQHGQYDDVSITYEDDTPFLDTFGMYINRIADMEYRDELLKVLIPMQMQLERSVFGDTADDSEHEEEQEKETTTMNEYDRQRRITERNKVQYPPGTRVMLLHMGEDPNPVANNTRGTVKFVDDLGTLHCAFDNGRTLGIIPGEDDFRKLTESELAEEQEQTMDEDEGPVMGM